MNNYYSGNGEYQSQFDAIFEEFVPRLGPADTLAGECVRAISRINYDFYNNGFGNNTSGALNFVKSYIDYEVYDILHEYTCGRVYNDNYGDDYIHNAVVKMTDQVLAMIVDNPQTMTIENKTDLFDLQESDLQICERCGDAFDDFGSVCEMCESEQAYA